jgi:hypothetical protein
MLLTCSSNFLSFLRLAGWREAWSSAAVQMTFRITIVLSLIFCSLLVSGQKASCACDSISSEAFQLDCNKRKLGNGALLFYQFNCDSIWLTLQNARGKTRVLYSIPTRLHDYHDRVGWVFYREYRDALLFRKDCVPPTGCDFFLVDKTTGHTRLELGEIIDCPGMEKLKGLLFFLDSSSDKKLKLVLYYPDSGKRIELPLKKADFNSENPNQQFGSIRLNGNILSVSYRPGESNPPLRTLRFDLRRYGGKKA